MTWINVTSFSNVVPNIISNGNLNSDRDGYSFFVQAGNSNLRAELGSSSANQLTTASITKKLTAGVWALAGMRWDGANLTLFQNGVQIESVAQTITPSAGVYATNIGRNSGGTNFYFPGIIEDVRIYKRALSNAEMWAAFNPPTRWQLRYVPGLKTWSFAAPATGNRRRRVLCAGRM